MDLLCTQRNETLRLHTYISKVYGFPFSCVSLTHTRTHAYIHDNFWHVYTSLSAHTHIHIRISFFRTQSVNLVFKFTENFALMNVVNKFTLDLVLFWFQVKISNEKGIKLSSAEPKRKTLISWFFLSPFKWFYGESSPLNLK